MALWGLNSPRAMNFPSWLRTSTSSPGAGSPSTRAIEVANSQGCRAKKGRALRGFKTTREGLSITGNPARGGLEHDNVGQLASRRPLISPLLWRGPSFSLRAAGLFEVG